jgi:hypothetical protein
MGRYKNRLGNKATLFFLILGGLMRSLLVEWARLESSGHRIRLVRTLLFFFCIKETDDDFPVHVHPVPTSPS